MITERNAMRRTTSSLTRILLLPILLFVLAAAAAQGQIPQLLNYQGVLSDAARTAVPDGSYTVAFRIYDAPTGGAMLWEEMQPVVTVDGIFEAILGTRTPMILPFDAPYWMALELQGEPEMSPRVQFVSTPYAMNAMSAQSALTLDAAASDVVHTLNGLDGRLQIVGGGIATVTEAGSTISIVVPDMLPAATADGEVIRWNSVAGAWQALPITVETSARLSGDGSAAAPLDIAPMGASDGEALVWDAATSAWAPGRMTAATAGVLRGDGSTADPITLANGTTAGQIVLWNGTSWVRSGGAAPSQGEVLAWNAATNSWEPAGSDVITAEEISGDGSTASPLRLAPQGATEGEVLRWDASANAWRPGPSLDALAPPFAGNGSPSDPLRLADGTNTGMLLYWNGTAWTRTAAVTPSNGWIMRWNAATTTWEPAQLSVTGLAALTSGSIWYGNASNTAAELPIGTANQLLTVSGTAPRWTSDITVDTVRAEAAIVSDDLQIGGDARVTGTTRLDGDLIANDSAAFNGPTRFAQFPEIGLQENAMIVGDANDRASIVPSTNESGAVLQQNGSGTPTWSRDLNVDAVTVNTLDAAGDVTTDGNLIVNGTEVRLPAGSIDNTELENSRVHVRYGSGVSGDGAVFLGDTLDISNTGLLTATEGAGIDVVVANGNATITNTGVTSVAGTPNQVSTSSATGDVTLSLPQDIHANATPTFDGLTLDNLSGGSTAGNFVVAAPGGALQTRTINLIPSGTTTNATLVWNGTAWVENTRVTMNPATGATAINGATTVTGDLTVTGPNVNLPNGSVGNAELANSTINMSYGTGVGGDASVALGGTLNLQNTGVTSAIAGTGVSVSGATGAVTITNTGLLGAAAGTGIGVNTVAGIATITNTGVTSIAGTANQVNASASTGAVTLSLPQNIHAGASPTFTGATLTGLSGGSTAGNFVVAGPGGLLQTRTINLLPTGTTTNATLVWNGTAWVENTRVTMNPATGATAINGATTVTGDLTVTGPNVNLPNGSVGNAELANSSVTINTGTGLSGGGNVALGGTLNLANTGVTSAIAGTGVSVNNATGAVTITNTGVTSIAGTANQVNASASTGAVTLSLPQNIHAGASPTFTGATLTALAGGSTAGNFVVAGPGGLLQTRTINLLPNGTTTNATLVWNGTAWVENTRVTMNPATGATAINGATTITGATTVTGDLTVTGPNVNLPNGSVGNAELANSSVTINTGTGLSGGGNVALGGTLNLANTGVTSAIAGTGIGVNNATGAVTITNTGLLGAAAGTGIGVNTVAGVATITNTGVTQAIGTANQVNVSPAGGTGNVTFSLPQNIDPNATPTFDGLTLDNLSGGSTAGNFVVAGPGGTLQTRTITLLPAGTTTNATLVWNGTAWVENTRVTMNPASGDVNVVGGDVTLSGGDLVVTTGDVTVPNGVINNNELQNSSVTINTGTGLSGGGNVALGGTLNLTNSGVTSAIAGAGINVNNATGAVTITNTGLLSAAAGTGIGVNTVGGVATITNTGVTSLSGTPNQVNVSASTGAVTLSLPQNIDPNATPTFDGVTLDNLTGGSTSSTALVLGPGNAVQTRTINILPSGTTTNATLVWNGTAWVENTRVTMNPATGATAINGATTITGATTVTGDLTVTGPNANLPNGSVSNAELANSSIALAYGTGLSGDASVALGGTLNLQNTGVTSAIAGTGIGVSGATGAVTITNTGLLGAAAGTGIGVNTVAGVATITNTGVTQAIGTANQVNVSPAGGTGNVTFSLPQNIDQNATPTFNGVTLDALATGSTSNDLLVSNGGVVETRTVASVLAGLSGQFWNATGNAGTTPGTNFLGTTDAQAFQIHVDNANSNATNGRGRVMRFEPNNTSANIIGGFKSNSVGGAVVGATIAGGGRNGNINTVTADYGVIGGGYGHTVAGTNSTIGGGTSNNIAGGNNNTIAGGVTNTVQTGSNTSFIGGGQNNTVQGSNANAVIGGGLGNSIRFNASGSVIGGGLNNLIDTTANASTIGGGSANLIDNTASNSTIAGGAGHIIQSNTSAIGGGDNAFIGLNARWSSIDGGHNNRIADNSFESTIGAGEGNDIMAGSVRGTIGGGSFNDIGTSSSNSTIAGGYGQGIGNNADRSTIGGGMSNAIRQGASISTIGGGFQNVIDTSANTSTISGGSSNLIDNNSTNSTIAGGGSNTILTTNSAIGGGINNAIRQSAGNSTIGGGSGNVIDTSASSSAISGGSSNLIDNSASNSTIAGGASNTIATNSNTSAIGGGQSNAIATGTTRATIAGGYRNAIATGSGSSAILGGELDSIGVNSFGSTITGGVSNAVTGRLSTVAGGRGLTINAAGTFGFLGNNDAGNRNMTITDANTALFGNTDLWLANNDNSASALRFYEANSTTGAFPGTANYSSFAAQAQTADINYILPAAAGAVGTQLSVGAVAGTNVTLAWSNSAASQWSLTGNAGTTVGTNFLGTTDDEPFQIHVDNANTTGTDGRGRALRIEPNNFSPNIIGGFSGNTVVAGAVGSVIAGGGLSTQINSIAANNSVIGGGVSNLIETGASQSVVAGGSNNRIRNFATTATIGGGASNEIQATATDGTIGGGNGNVITANTQWATVAGGRGNSVGAHAASILGGQANAINASAFYATIAGGIQNAIGSGAQRSAILGGGLNTVSGGWSAILGGQGLTLSGTSSFGFLANNTASTRDMSVSLSNVAVFGNNDLWLANNDNSASALRFYEANSTTGVFPGTTNYSSFAAGTQTADIDYILPDTAGAVGDMLAVRSVVGTTVTLDWDAVAASASAWELTGNAGTTAGTDFLGTTDDEPFQIHVDNANATPTNGRGRVMRYEPNATSPNILGGFSGNTITAGVTGATIAGGGENGRVNAISSSSSVISGGTGNAIAASSTHSVIAGGDTNLIGSGSQRGVIGGGASNEIGANTTRATIAGGQDNGIGANSFQSTIGGGAAHRVGDNSRDVTIAGGGINWVGATSPWGTISGGYRNYIRDNVSNATITGGLQDTIYGSAHYSTIAGGAINTIGTNSSYSFIGGGTTNAIGVSSNSSVIGGGNANRIDSTAVVSTIAGGYRNLIVTDAGGATISGGTADTIGENSWESTIGGGASNVIRKNSWHSTISGGGGNIIDSTSAGSVISGGSENQITGRISTIAGGRGLTLVGAGSFGFLGNNDVGTRDMTLTATNTAAFGNTDMWLVNNDNSASAMRFYEANNTIGAFPATVNHSSFEAGTQTADIRYILPDTAGIVGDVLSVRAVAGTTVTMDWAAAGGSSDWSRTGNAGTTPGTNFIGTTDAQAFEIHVDEAGVATEGRRRVMRYEPNATSANIIGGFSGNTIAGGVVAGTIAGGGQSGAGNTISSSYGTISGGRGNSIGASSINATIAGGVSNQVGSSAGNGTVSGGLGNVITSGDHATIGGGFNNRINAGSFGSTMGGGTNNAVSSHTSVIDGGNGNTIGTSSQFSKIGGGHQNAIVNSAFESTISGGTIDTIETSASYSTIGGGTSNAIRSSSTRSVIAGGYNNEILSGADRAVVSGGEENIVGGARSAILGGRGLTLSGSGSVGFLGGNTGTNNMTVSTINTAVFGNTDLWLANNDNAASELRFYEANATTGAFPGTANYTAFAAGTQTADITYTLPTAAPTVAGQVLGSTTGGVMSWVDGPTNAQAFANNSSATATLQLTNSEATNNDGIALRVNNGGFVGSASTANQAGGTLPENKMIVRVADNGVGSSQPAVTLPAAVDGTIIYLIVEDVDGVNITNALAAGIDPNASGVFTLIQYNNGTTSVWAVSR